MNVRDASAIVTGTGMGIGRGVALRLAREGAAVTVVDRDAAAANDCAARIRDAGGTAIDVVADVTNDSDIAAMIVAANEAHGPVTVLVSNAGGAGDGAFPFAEPEEWRRVIELNLIAVMSGIQQVLPTMREAGGGAIVTIASVGGLGYGQYALADYGAAKAGVVRLTNSLGGLAETDRVRVNCICPGLVDTPASRRSRAKLPPDRQPTVWLTTDDIGAAVMHLIGDDSLAGRVLVWHEGQPWQLVPLDQEPLGVHS